jgi:hypothetical protein
MAAIPQGAIRFNTDSQKLEFYAQDQWFEMVIDTPALGRVLILVQVLVDFWWWWKPVAYNVIDYINISSTGNAIDFGDLSRTTLLTGACSSSNTRGLWAGDFPSAIPN